MESYGEIVGTVALHWVVAILLLLLIGGLAEVFERIFPLKWTRNGVIGKR